MSRSQFNLRRARESLQARLLNQTGFLGLGAGTTDDGSTAIVVLVVAENSPVVQQVPSQWEGWPVQLRAVGKARRFDS